MATQLGPKKILRVGIIQNGRIIEERLLRSHEVVSVGRQLKNTFVIASSAFPKSLNLFNVSGQKYTLNISEQMTGRMSLGDGIFDVEALKKAGRAKKTSSGYRIELSERSRGKVALNDVTILFQFVTPPPLRVLPQLPIDMRGGILYFVDSVLELRGGLLFAMLFSLIIQGGGIGYLVLRVPPPPRSESLNSINNRFIQVAMEQEEPEEQEQEEGETETSEDGQLVAEAAEEVAEEETDNRDSEDDSQSEPQTEAEERAVVRDRYSGMNEEERTQEARTQAITQSALVAFGGSADGVISIGVTDSFGSSRAQDAIANQAAIGEGGGTTGLVSNTGIASTGSANGSGGRLGMESGPSTITDGSGPNETTDPDPDDLEIVTEVHQQDPIATDRGHLDLTSVLRRKRNQIVRCYQRGLARDPSLSGRVEIQFIVNRNGRAENVRLRSNDLGSEVGNCITGRVRSWRFDEPTGGSVAVRIPYIFSSSN